MDGFRNPSSVVVALRLFKMVSGSGVVGLTDSLLSLSLTLAIAVIYSPQKVILGTWLSLKRVKYSRIPND